MAVTFLEAGTDSTFDFSLWNQNAFGTGTLTSDTTHVQDGLRAIKGHTASPGDGSAIFTSDGIVADAGTRISAWYYFSTNTPSALTQIMSPETSGNGSLVFGLGMNTNGTLLLGARGTVQLSGSTVLPANTWVRISMAYVLTSVSSYTCKVFINGALEITLTQATGNAGLTGSTCCSFGQNTSSQNGFTSTAAMDIWMDSIYIDNSSALTDPGNIHVTAKRPFANGTTTGFTTQIGSGGSGYGSGHAPQVNERPLSITNGWSMVGAGSAVTEEYTIENAATGDVNLTGATIVDYMGWVDVKALAAETGQIIVGGTNSNISVTTSPAIFIKVKGSSTYPAGGTDIGVVTSTTVTTFSLYECGIIVAYIPVSGSISELTLLGAS